MKRNSFFLLVFFLSSCTSLKTVGNLKLPHNADSKIKVNFKAIGHKSNHEFEKYKRAAQLAEKVLNSEAFEKAVLEGPSEQFYINEFNHEDVTKKCEGDALSSYTYNVVSGKCLTNEDVYNALAANSWEISVRINYRWWALWCAVPFVDEIGHRAGELIVTQECHFDNMSDEYLAGHLIHEYLHVIGFDHPVEDTKNRIYTVPYFVGNRASELLRKL